MSSFRLGSCIRLLVLTLLLGAIAHAQPSPHNLPRDISLDGFWQCGINRVYTEKVPVPGLAQDPAQMSPGSLWYKRTVVLPSGDWNVGTLTLHGARFDPRVYVDGHMVSSQQGGMAPTVHVLRSPDVAPGRTIQLEIALSSLKDVSPEDASSVAEADRWRSNVSSGLWDDVTLHFSRSARLTSVIPWTDFTARRLTVHWQADWQGNASTGAKVSAEILSPGGRVLAGSSASAAGDHGIVAVSVPQNVVPWTPDTPHVYRLRLTLSQSGRTLDVSNFSWGFKDFHAANRKLYLDGQPIEMLGGSVVWERFLRQPGAADVAFNTAWFKKNIVSRLKSYGANTLRFHMGLPPERLLDLCDREGVMVQMEWSFFHGIPASEQSMREQYRSWLNVAMRHPSVVVLQPWNETDDPAALKKGWAALDSLLPNYPPLVFAYRNTIHIHKYWWSLFENLGLYYDSANQFPKTVIVDEFGGNYLDFKGDPGLYPAVKGSFLRFLGRHQTRKMRLYFQAEANARVAEYWRRLGVAGVLPFCILGSPQDGDTWFLGSLQHPRPKPVWNALAAAWAPLSVSLDIWDRNFLPAQRIQVPLYFFNDTDHSAPLTASLQIVTSATGTVVSKQTITQRVAPHSQVHRPVEFTLPSRSGTWVLNAKLLTPVSGVTHPIVSSWKVRTLIPRASLPPGLRVGVPADETELRQFLHENGVAVTSFDDPSAQLLLTSATTWKQLEHPGPLRSILQAAIDRGASVVMLDVGPHDLGEGYRKKHLGTLDGAPRLQGNGYSVHTALISGVSVTFQQVAEPESDIQPGPSDRDLWKGLPIQATWLWNGLRGGLIAPAADMQVAGLSQAAIVSQWQARGADPSALTSGKPYFAYNLDGYYAFSPRANDKSTMDALRAKVRFLAADAPALRAVLTPNAPIIQSDLSEAWHHAAAGKARHLLVLSTCGKNLTRMDIVELTFGPAKGNLILSQALTAGRLVKGEAKPGFYGIRYDPAAEQFVLNMLAKALRPFDTHSPQKGKLRR